MTLQQLKILVLLDQYKKVVVVSELVKLKQPTVTFHMKKLEEYLGVSLFERRQNRIFLTYAANAILPYARRIVASAEEAEATIVQLLLNEQSKIAIGCSFTASYCILPTLLTNLKNSFPQVEVDIKIDRPEKVAAMLSHYQIDFGFIPEYWVKQHQSVTRVPLLNDKVGFIMYPSHRLSDQSAIHPIELENEHWLVRESGTLSRRAFDEWASTHHLKIATKAEFSAMDALKTAIKSQLGITISHYLSFFNEINKDELVFKETDTVVPLTLCFIYENKRQYTPLMRKLIGAFSSPSFVVPEELSPYICIADES